MVTSFVPLRLRSRHTRFCGTMAPAAIASYLADAGFGAGALLDRDNIRGAVEFYEACLARGVKPRVGADLSCPVTGAGLAVIALDRQGYANLCAAISSAHLRPETPLLEAIGEAPAGIAAFSGDGESALRLRDLVGPERCWLEIAANRDAGPAMRQKLDFARRNSLAALATWDAWCTDESDYKVSRVLKAIGDGKTVDEVHLDAKHPSLAGCRLGQLFAERPEVLRQSVRLAEMSDLRLDLGKPHFPRVAASPAESLARLESMCRQALRAKYPARRDTALARLTEELRVVGALGMADYFLVVADLVGFAVRAGIPVAGRGSGAGAIIAYLLGITQTDPVSENLLFERFLNELRPDYPDLDIDLSWKRRDEVIAYAYRRFGISNVAMISTDACFELRLAAREVGKAVGLSPYEAQALADRLPRHGCEDPRGDIERALGNIKPELGPELRATIGQMAAAIVGLPDHSSVHCGGIVVSDRPITYYTPLEMAAKGIQVTQFDMRAIERLGLVKIDLLGNRALSMIEDATGAMAAKCGGVEEIAPDDQATAHLLRQGRTLSCFQLESPAMRSLLAMLRASTRSEATLALALVRPGPSAGGMKQEFVRRHAQEQGLRPRGNDLPVYEEDVMRLIAETTGTGLAEADVLRRSVKDRLEDETTLESKFVFMARSAGTSEGEARRAWQIVKRFARYSFCKAHAASFGTLAYSAAYLKANFPLQFYLGVLRNHSGMYPVWVHVNEARRVGVRVLPPSINRSQGDFAIEDGAIRTGLGSVKHLSRATIEAALMARRQGPFQSLADFLARAGADREEVLALIGSGAFDDVEAERCVALTAYLASRGRMAGPGTPPLGFAEVPVGPRTRAFTPMQKRRMEYAALGFSPLVHPLEFFETFPPAPPASSRCGLLAAMRHYTDKGPGMWFVTLDRPEGVTECIVPDTALRLHLVMAQAYRCVGLLQNRLGALNLRVRSITGLPEKFM